MGQCGQSLTKGHFRKRHNGHLSGICTVCDTTDLDHRLNEGGKSDLGTAAWTNETHVFYVRLRDNQTAMKLICQYKLCAVAGHEITASDLKPTAVKSRAILRSRMHERCSNQYRRRSLAARRESHRERKGDYCVQCGKNIFLANTSVMTCCAMNVQRIGAKR